MGNIVISDELFMYIFQIHKMPRMVKVIIAMLLIDVIDFAALFFSSVMEGNRGSVKICCSGVLCGLGAASVL